VKWGGGGYVLSSDDIEWMLDHYLNNRDEGNDWRASPIVAKSFADLPAALVVTADHDPLVDEGKSYADRLSGDGVAAEYACFDGTFHGFLGYASLIEVGRRALDLICNRIGRAVSK
jgi:acetyl esterase